MAAEIRSYEDLDVWERGIDLAVRLYAVAGSLPPSEKYEMSSQLRRAAVSVPSNVAEGPTGSGRCCMDSRARSKSESKSWVSVTNVESLPRNQRLVLG